MSGRRKSFIDTGAVVCAIGLGLIIAMSTGAVARMFKVNPEFGAYEAVLRRSTNGGDKVHIFQSVWGAIRVDFPDDTEKTKELYSQLSNFISNEQKCSDASGRAACELQQEVRRHLRKLTAQHLANMLNSEQSVNAYNMYLTSSLELALVRDIYAMVIDDIYHYKAPERLVGQLYQIHTANDEASFKVMIEAQLALYWKFRHEHDINDEYLIAAAYYLNRIMVNHLYANVGTTTDRRVLEAYRSLPDTLQQLFATRGFCLWNKAHSEFLYTTVTDEMNFGSNGRYVFTWFQKNYTDSSAVLRAFVNEEKEDAANQLPRLTIRGELYKWYLYLESSKNNLLAAWRSGSPTPTSTWRVQHIDGFLVFRQQELTLCTGDARDEERRFVNGFKRGMLMPLTDDCLWQATHCNFE